jgi:hypothetical protein
MTLIYLATPYTDADPAVRLRRFHEACKKAVDLMQQGFLVFSPIAHSHPLAAGWGLPVGFDYWEQFDRRMIAACDEVYVLKIDGWLLSTGVQAEIAIAAELHKPITFIEP